MNEFQKWLQAQSIENFDELSEGVQTTLKAAFEASLEGGGGNELEDDFQTVIANNKAERDRIKAITALVAAACGDHPALVDKIEALGRKAIRGKADPKDFELELLRSTRPTGPTNIAGGDEANEISSKVIEAAICKRLNLDGLDEQFSERTLDATDKHFRHGIGLQQLLFRAAAANGEHFDSVHNLKGLLRAAFGHNRVQASGFSSFSLPGILSNTMNKFLVMFFNKVENTWMQIAARRPVNDFKTVTSYSLTGANEYEKVGPTGEIKSGTLGEQTYTNKAETYAKMLGISRQDIRNDDLGAFQAIPQRLGRGGALKINDVFWTAFMDNSTFFTAGNGNYDDGTDTVLDIDGLTNAETLFLNQTDPDGKPLGAAPRFLLTPNALYAKGTALMRSTEVRPSGTANTTLEVSNPHAGKWEPIRSSYLSNAAYTGNSALAWYLLADPMDLPVIEICFLDGREVPFIESADANFDVLGIQVRGYHDFGVTKQEYRGGVKMKGEA